MRRFRITSALLISLAAISSGSHRFSTTEMVAAAASQTFQDFDTTGTTYQLAQCLLAPPATVLAGGPTGNFLRLVTAPDPPPSANAIAFPSAGAGAATLIVADFDFRITPVIGRADGFGFALLNSAAYSDPAVCPSDVPEEPNFTQSFGVGFDIYQSPDLGETSNNHISIHFNGAPGAAPLLQREVKTLDIAGGHWLHARILMRVRPAGGSPSDVTVVLTPPNGASETVVEAFPVPGWVPYDGRPYFSARAGGQSAHHDLDNVRVQFFDTPQSVLSFSAASYATLETDGSRTVTVNRTGDVTGAASVQYSTFTGTATPGSDYTHSAGALAFAPLETQKTFTIPILNDASTEAATETFLVRLSNPSSGAVTADPSTTTVRIGDDETARSAGYWSDVLAWPLVAIHMALLPTGKVMFWENRGQNDELRLWDPTTGALTMPALPGFDIFCAGHSFLADGTLLVTGGHIHDNEGLADVARYDPFANTWSRGPAMNAGRWYPTNTPLASGDTLVISGDIAPGQKNFLPQVWQAATGMWRNLTGAQSDPNNAKAHGYDLYPRMFLAPDGRLFKAGTDPDTWFLNLTGTGSWSAGPPTLRATDPTVGDLNRSRTYGPAVIRDGTIFTFGGAQDPPTASAEALDLNAPTAWVSLPPMAVPRRHHNATLLPDGKILITGGTSSPGFSDGAQPALAAELFDPDTNTWATLASMQVKRLYHSNALLLPDGRVLSAGGGEPVFVNDYDHRDAEVFSPPYLFKGPRPIITTAPTSVQIGHTFVVDTPNAGTIARASLIRLGAPTHAFDMNQLFVSLPFAIQESQIKLKVPSNPNVVPPGHYMLFLVNVAGVPSVAKIVRLDVATTAPPATPPLFSTSGGSTLAGSSKTFQWSAGEGVVEYWLQVGNSPGSTEYFHSSVGANRSASVLRLPLDGGPIYARLWFRRSGSWCYEPLTCYVDTQVTAAYVPGVVLGLTTFAGNGGWFANRGGAEKSFAADPWTRLPWANFNAAGGGLRPAVGDVDGDGLNEIVLGLSSGAGAGWVAILDDALHGHALLAWRRVQWDIYNNANGEVFPAVGDLDGDGKAEIVLGLGAGGNGWIEILDDASGNFDHLAWRRVPAVAGDGSTHPAVADVDGDGTAEIVVGLGRGSGGVLEVIGGSASAYAHRVWLQVTWGPYNNANGVTYPAAGDLDGDGKAEIVVGLGTGSLGWLEIFDDASHGFAHVAWTQTSWGAYNNDVGETHPAIGNVDRDHAGEIVIGLAAYPGQGGWFEILDDQNRGFARLGWRSLDWVASTAAGVGTFPAMPR